MYCITEWIGVQYEGVRERNFEVFGTLMFRIKVFWVFMLSSRVIDCYHFKGMYHLHHQR